MPPRQRAAQNLIQLYFTAFTKSIEVAFAKGISLLDGINQQFFGIDLREFGSTKAQGTIEVAQIDLCV
jgi:hypothetical protein